MPTNPHRGAMKETARLSGRTISKTRQLHMERTLLNIEHLKQEEVFDYYVQAQVPEAWDTLEQDVDVEEMKVKASLYLDESVLKFYRAMGKGYHARINRVLATFAQMRIAQVKRVNEMLDEELAQIAALRDDAEAF
ncbi:MAG: BrnA antitoxin family protein [Rhodobacter sp.]|nr:BrnA antitoxin family protein [Rhodobacter sp.]